MVVAALLLMISAALLVTRLKLKPDFYVPPPAAEQSLPAPAAEAPAVPEAPFQPEVTPNPEADPAPPAAAAPGTAPESEPEAPTPAPAAPRAITPSANPVHIQAAPTVRLGDARGDGEAIPEPVSLRSDGGQSLPPGLSVTVIEAN